MFKVPTQGTALYVSFPVVQSPTLGLNIDRYITHNSHPRVVHNISSSWQKFLSSWIVIIECQRRSLLGGLGACPPANFYILSPQRRNFLDSEHKFPIMSVPKLIKTFQFYLYKLMSSVVFYNVIPRSQRNELIIVYLCAN